MVFQRGLSDGKAVFWWYGNEGATESFGEGSHVLNEFLGIHL